MHGYVLFSLVSVLLFLSFTSVPKSNADVNLFAFPTPTPFESAIKIESFELDRTVVAGYCPWLKEGSDCKDIDPINVTTLASSKNSLRYSYTVSAGKIEGEGAKVVWNLTGMREGDYSITVEVSDDSDAKPQTATRNVKTVACDCHPPPKPCNCQNISITTRVASVKVGKVVTFAADVKENPEEKLSYNWTISGGEIVQGQGTSQIKVKTTAEMADSNLTATIDIGGTDPNCGCQTRATKTISITGKSK